MRPRHIRLLLLLALGVGCYDQPMATAPDLTLEPFYIMDPGPASVLTEIWPVADAPQSRVGGRPPARETSVGAL